MIQNRFEVNSFAFIVAQNRLYQIVQVRGDILTPFPAQQQPLHITITNQPKPDIIPIRRHKRRRTDQHHKQTHSQRPNISLIRMELLCIVYLRCFVACFADKLLAHKLGLILLELLNQPKIDELNMQVIYDNTPTLLVSTNTHILRKHDVFQRNIQITTELLLMHPPNELDHLHKHTANVLLPVVDGQMTALDPSMCFDYEFKQTLSASLHHQIEVLSVHEEVVEFDARRRCIAFGELLQCQVFAKYVFLDFAFVSFEHGDALLVQCDVGRLDHNVLYGSVLWIDASCREYLAL
mmetsp:Transcript_68299/g.108440  ORF Transcript_68299/g.108440 Transcript_68299/m.108440 type:complete len:294 (-) Transcript_68299:386-1267(-)